MVATVELGTLRQIIGAAEVKFEDLRPLSIRGFKGLFVMRKSRGMKVSHWLNLNQILTNLGYTAVFVAELDRLQYLSDSLDQAQEFYKDFHHDFFSDFSPPKDKAEGIKDDFDTVFAPPAERPLAFGQEVLLRQKLHAALENLNASASEPVDSISSAGYATAMRFFAGDDCILSTEAFEQAALKLDQLESIELVPGLETLRERHRVPGVRDYEQAAGELDLTAWLEAREDSLIEQVADDNNSDGDAVRATRAQEFIDCVQYLLLVPVVESDQVPAFFHLGGVNDMPPPHVHIALMRRWAEVYATRPRILGLGTDSIYVHVGKPVSSEAAQALAVEQFRYCPDNVLKTLGSVGRLAREITDCDLWQFWWE